MVQQWFAGRSQKSAGHDGIRCAVCSKKSAVTMQSTYTRLVAGPSSVGLIATALLSALLVGCGTGLLAERSVPVPVPQPRLSTVPVLPALPELPVSPVLPVSQISPAQASDVTIYAVGLIGIPYRSKGNTLAAGFDSSGLISHVYQKMTGLSPPRSVAGLQNWGQPLLMESIRSGDLVFFGGGDVATHAGIYVGDGRFVHAPSTGGTVRIDQLNSKYWLTQRVAFRRP